MAIPYLINFDRNSRHIPIQILCLNIDLPDISVISFLHSKRVCNHRGIPFRIVLRPCHLRNLQCDTGNNCNPVDESLHFPLLASSKISLMETLWLNASLLQSSYSGEKFATLPSHFASLKRIFPYLVCSGRISLSEQLLSSSRHLKPSVVVSLMRKSMTDESFSAEQMVVIKVAGRLFFIKMGVRKTSCTSMPKSFSIT